MLKSISPYKKVALVVLIITIGLAILPAEGASAASFHNEASAIVNLPVGQTDSISTRGDLRLERIWSRRRAAFQLQGDRLARADDFINMAQSLIDKANQKGGDTADIQAALDAFQAVIPAAQAAYNPGVAIIANHKGFDANGKVTDRQAALDSVQSLGQVLKDTHSALDHTGQAFFEAVKTFRAAHKPASAPTKIP